MRFIFAQHVLRVLSLTVIGILPLPALAAANSVLLKVTEPAGIARKPGWVTAGVPYPIGHVRPETPLGLRDEAGKFVPVQTQTTATWRDGSRKWVLLDFPCEMKAGATRQFTLTSGTEAAAACAEQVRVDEKADLFVIHTGPLRFAVAKNHLGILENVFLDRNGDKEFSADEKQLAEGIRLHLQTTNLTLRALAPDEIKVEEPGPHRVVVKIAGWMNDGSTNLVRYLWRIHAQAGSSRVTVHHTITQLSDRDKMLWVTDHSLEWRSSLDTGASVLLGGQPQHHPADLKPSQNLLLTQLAEGSYRVSSGTNRAAGFKAPGWLHLASTHGGLLVGTRNFWQQFPKAFEVTRTASDATSATVRLGLYPRECGKPLDFDQGLAKTHEFVFDFVAGGLNAAACEARIREFEQPLFAVAPREWYCDSKVFGDLLPFNFDLFPEYETLTEASGDQLIKKMATGWRYWGDVYYGGEYKGTNSYMNLEYDVHHNFYCQFARTGLRKYLDTAVTMAGHQADIDTNHKTGWQWKHSPRHVETRAEFGHTFTRGLLETWFLTGNRRCLEAAIELGDYFSQAIRNPRELGNERQIGWSLISLLPVYEATWDKKYFVAAQDTIERLLKGLEDKGKFSIRWDNRISFFNGIAATGFIYYHRATGDERVAEAVLKVMRRTRGFYPEYAGRTLEAIAWAYERTREPEYLDLLQRTWETTLARQITWNTMELGAPTIFTAHALPFLAGSEFIAKPERPLNLTPEQFATENGMWAHHLPSGDADLFLRAQNQAPFDLVIIRKGAWKAPGSAAVFDPTGKQVATLQFPAEGVVWQRRVVPISPTVTGPYRIALRSVNARNVKGGSYVTWDIATSRALPAVFATPEFQGLQFVTPYLYTMPRGDTPTIELELSGEGEGFKKAVVFDPDGHVAGSSEAFIDLGDKGRYFYKVVAKIPPHQMNRLWRVSLQEVSLVKMTGLSPYFSTSPQAFFQPDRSADK